MIVNNSKERENKVLYRILTENKNYQNVANIVSAKFEDFVVIKAEEYQQGKARHSLIIEIVYDSPLTDTLPTLIISLCYDIKKLNSQQAVLVQIIGCEGTLI